MNKEPLRVLLVDDEQNTRNLLKLCINWKALGMEVIADADSGIEALNLIDELKPDIILTDIEMPYMDGISLSKQIKEHYLDIYIIIITAHEQFSYAQQAISIGVSDFILKPIDPELIMTTLRKLAEKIKEKREKLTQLEVSYQYIKNNLTELKSRFLNELLAGNTTNIGLFKELEVVQDLWETDITNAQIALISILFDTAKYTTAQKYAILQNCITYIEESFCKGRKLYAFIDTHNHITLFGAAAEIYLPEISEHITNYFKSNLKTSVYCGIGNMVSNLDQLPASYHSAKDALRLCHILNEEIVYNEESLKANHDLSTESPLDHLILLVKSGLNDQALEASRRLLHSSLNEDLKDLSSIKYQAINILSKVTDTLLAAGIPVSSLSFTDLSYSHLIELSTYAEIEKYVTGIISEFCDLMNKTNANKQSDTVSQVISYVENHYADEELSLASLSKQFYINPSYLSRIFKKITNKSFTEYLVELRVQKAIQMLNVSNYKAYQLAQMVGIPDPNYFIKCFKKVTGVSLQEFKSQMV